MGVFEYRDKLCAPGCQPAATCQQHADTKDILNVHVARLRSLEQGPQQTYLLRLLKTELCES